MTLKFPRRIRGVGHIISMKIKQKYVKILVLKTKKKMTALDQAVNRTIMLLFGLL
jgi:hypothetical protein